LQEREEPLTQHKENATGLPDSLKAGVESLSGIAMDDVNVHYNSSKPAEMQALAYTQGTEIHVASGQEKHLPHEAWHVVQQKEGRVKPTSEAMGRPLNDEPHLEREADILGKQATMNTLQDGSAFPSLIPPTRKMPTSVVNGRAQQTLPEVQGVRLILGHPIENQLPIQATFAVQIVLSEEVDTIGEEVDTIDELRVGDRPPSPFSGTMGAHSTAWMAHVLALQAQLKGLSILKAFEEMKTIIKEEKSSEAMHFRENLPQHNQQVLVDAMNDMDATVKKAQAARPARAVSALQEVIAAYFTFINYLPFATIEVGEVPKGRAEGTWVDNLKKYEAEQGKKRPTEKKKQELRGWLWGLFDHKAVETAAKNFLSKEELYRALWITRLRIHLKTIGRAFPKATAASEIATPINIFTFLQGPANIHCKDAVAIANEAGEGENVSEEALYTESAGEPTDRELRKKPRISYAET
jgi:hypothetical protein